MPNKRLLYQQAIIQARKAKEEHEREQFSEWLSAFLKELDKIRHELYEKKIEIRQTRTIQNIDRRKHVQKKLLELEINCSKKYDNLIYNQFQRVLSEMHLDIEVQLGFRRYGILEKLITALESDGLYDDLCCAISRMPITSLPVFINEHYPSSCNKNGARFDLLNLLAWLKTNNANPVTGREMKDLKQITFDLDKFQQILMAVQTMRNQKEQQRLYFNLAFSVLLCMIMIAWIIYLKIPDVANSIDMRPQL